MREMKAEAALLAICTALLVSNCAPTTAKYDQAAAAYSAECKGKWGPVNSWTPQQMAAYINGISNLKREMWTSYNGSLYGGPPPPPSTVLPEAIGPRHYEVAVESEPAGAAVEVNGDYRGRTPCTVTVMGTPSRGVLAQGLVVTALPSRNGDYVQTKGFLFGSDLPKHIFFNMSLGPVTPTVDVNMRNVP